MFVAYCKACLPTKVVLAYGGTRASVSNIAHEEHPPTYQSAPHPIVPDKTINIMDPLPVGIFEIADIAGSSESVVATIIANHADLFQP